MTQLKVKADTDTFKAGEVEDFGQHPRVTFECEVSVHSSNYSFISYIRILTTNLIFKLIHYGEF